MKLNKQGASRLVLMFDTFVIKVPNFHYKWSNFLTGMLANIRERDIYRWNSGEYESGNSHLLCPVLWASWGGWILVMKRAEALAPNQKPKYKKWKKAGFGGDDHVLNYGILDGRIVKLDYGSY